MQRGRILQAIFRNIDVVFSPSACQLDACLFNSGTVVFTVILAYLTNMCHFRSCWSVLEYFSKIGFFAADYSLMHAHDFTIMNLKMKSSCTHMFPADLKQCQMAKTSYANVTGPFYYHSGHRATPSVKPCAASSCKSRLQKSFRRCYQNFRNDVLWLDMLKYLYIEY